MTTTNHFMSFQFVFKGWNLWFVSEGIRNRLSITLVHIITPNWYSLSLSFSWCITWNLLHVKSVNLPKQCCVNKFPSYLSLQEWRNLVLPLLNSLGQLRNLGILLCTGNVGILKQLMQLQGTWLLSKNFVWESSSLSMWSLWSTVKTLNQVSTILKCFTVPWFTFVLYHLIFTFDFYCTMFLFLFHTKPDLANFF